jgi:hypothetical protein
MKSINNTESGDRNIEADEVPPVSSIGQAVSSFKAVRRYLCSY